MFHTTIQSKNPIVLSETSTIFSTLLEQITGFSGIYQQFFFSGILSGNFLGFVQEFPQEFPSGIPWRLPSGNLLEFLLGMLQEFLLGALQAFFWGILRKFHLKFLKKFFVEFYKEFLMWIRQFFFFKNPTETSRIILLEESPDKAFGRILRRSFWRDLKINLWRNSQNVFLNFEEIRWWNF